VARTPTYTRTEPYTRIEPVGVESNDERHARLVAELEDGGTAHGGMVLGMPPLPAGDMWVDAVGASVITKQSVATIRTRLARRERYTREFPAPLVRFNLQWWKLSVLTAWMAAVTTPNADDASTVTS